MTQSALKAHICNLSTWSLKSAWARQKNYLNNSKALETRKENR